MQNQKRKRSRVNASFPVTVLAPWGRIKARTFNISLKGMLCTHIPDLLPEEKYEIDLHLPSSIYIRVLAKVARTEDEYIAFDFVSMDPDSFYHLRNLIRLHAEDPDIIEQELHKPAFDPSQAPQKNKAKQKSFKPQSKTASPKEKEYMFKHILVPTDCTEQSKPGLDTAVKMHQQAQLPGAGQEISLLHVIEAIPGVQDQEFEKFYQSLKKKAQRKMEELLQAHQDKDLFINTQILVENRVQEIINFINSKEVNLVVMASHQIDPQNPAQGWGTISHKVSILAPCPVMLVK